MEKITEISETNSHLDIKVDHQLLQVSNINSRKSSPISSKKSGNSVISKNSDKSKSNRSTTTNINKNRNSHNFTQKNNEEISNINVYLRIRPNNSPETFSDVNFQIKEKSLIWPQIKRQDSSYAETFSFQNIFDGDTTQKQVYDQSVKSLVKNFLIGINCSFMAYGQTDSGKTYTILGPDSSEPKYYGMVKMATIEIFDTIQKMKDEDTQNLYNIDLTLSVFEIYAEKMFDL